jgi:hypothetical protein
VRHNSPCDVRLFLWHFKKTFVGGRRPRVNKVDCELPDAGASLAEVRRLREENSRLRGLLIAHDIRIPESANFTDETPQISNSAPEVRNSVVATAGQRIAIFRSLFRGREDVYAIRWENADGRSGYMPKADRDWKSYLSATAEVRKKVDRLTRTYRHSMMTWCERILLANIRPGYILSYRTRHVGSWRSILTRRRGSKTPPHFLKPA